MLKTLERSTNTCYVVVCIVASSPRDLTASCVSDSSILLSWHRPDPPNGIIKNYTVSVTMYGTTFTVFDMYSFMCTGII